MKEYAPIVLSNLLKIKRKLNALRYDFINKDAKIYPTHIKMNITTINNAQGAQSSGLSEDSANAYKANAGNKYPHRHIIVNFNQQVLNCCHASEKISLTSKIFIIIY